ncbi:MAG: hypothetical protein QOK34_281, partial [Gaiellaceae bacterium]|nr:hypothetical protein [Gaiellaceae bacterium]
PFVSRVRPAAVGTEQAVSFVVELAAARRTPEQLIDRAGHLAKDLTAL